MPITPPPKAERKRAEERRNDVLEAAVTEFAARGLHGASVDAVAKAAGISQPYIFRLFGSKKDLFAAAIARCMDEALAMFKQASGDLTGEAALVAMGEAYRRQVTADPRMLRAQLQAYAACDDPEIGSVVRAGFGRIVQHVESLGLGGEHTASFFARGMLINTIVAMDLHTAGDPWATRLAGQYGLTQ